MIFIPVKHAKPSLITNWVSILHCPQQQIRFSIVDISHFTALPKKCNETSILEPTRFTLKIRSEHGQWNPFLTLFQFLFCRVLRILDYWIGHVVSARPLFGGSSIQESMTLTRCSWKSTACLILISMLKNSFCIPLKRLSTMDLVLTNSLNFVFLFSIVALNSFWQCVAFSISFLPLGSGNACCIFCSHVSCRSSHSPSLKLLWNDWTALGNYLLLGNIDCS